MAEMHIIEKIIVNSKLDLIFHKWFGVSKLLNWAMVDHTEKILELGCGIGITTKFIAEKFNSAKIIALDYDKSQIQKAKDRQYNRNIKFIVGDATKLKFKNKSFDMVFEILAFHHIPNYEKAIAEVYRALKNGGKFILMDIPLKSINPFHKFFMLQPAEFTKKEFFGKLEEAGFVVRRSKGKIFFSVMALKS